MGGCVRRPFFQFSVWPPALARHSTPCICERWQSVSRRRAWLDGWMAEASAGGLGVWRRRRRLVASLPRPPRLAPPEMLSRPICHAPHVSLSLASNSITHFLSCCCLHPSTSGSVSRMVTMVSGMPQETIVSFLGTFPSRQ